MGCEAAVANHSLQLPFHCYWSAMRNGGNALAYIDKQRLQGFQEETFANTVDLLAGLVVLAGVFNGLAHKHKK